VPPPKRKPEKEKLYINYEASISAIVEDMFRRRSRKMLVLHFPGKG